MKILTNHYHVLGVRPDATEQEIHAAAQALGARFPEELRDPSTNAAFKQLATAYEILSSPEKRAAYDRELAASGSTLNVNVQMSRNTISVLDGEQLLYVLLDIRSPIPADKKDSDVPVNLCLVIDRSTSMQGTRLDQVKAAARLVIQQLNQDDIISIITFSDRAEVLSPAGHLHNRNLLSRRLDEMRASGGTEIYQGLKAGLHEMSNVTLERYINKLVLLTDGHTYGDEEECIQLASEAAGRGIVLSALGIGADWNDHFLDQLAAPSGGQTTFIEKPEMIIQCLQQQIDGLGAIYAQNVVLELDLPPSVTLNYAMKLAPFAQPVSGYQNRLKLGTVEGRAPLSLLLELSIKPERAGTTLTLPLKLTGDIPAKQLQGQVFQGDLELSVVSDMVYFAPPPVIIRAVQMLNLYRMNEQVWEDVEAGHLEQATSRMRRLSTRLMESGQTELAYDAIVETQRLRRMGTLSLEGRKKLKYGTRSLLTKTMSLTSHDEM